MTSKCDIFYLRVRQLLRTDPVNRAQILNDAIKLANSGIIKYATALDISLYLQYELEYVPWTAAFSAFEYLNEMLRRTGSYDKFKVRKSINE